MLASRSWNRTDNGAGRISISEGWGNYIGNTFTARKYDVIDTRISNFNRNRLENQTPDYIVDDDGWIVYGMLHDMTDNGEPSGTGVTDNVNSYTTAQLFQGLQNDVADVRGYQQRLLQQNGYRQVLATDDLVNSYRW